MRLEKHGGHMKELGVYSKSNERFCFMCNSFTDSFTQQIFLKNLQGARICAVDITKLSKTEPFSPSQFVSWGK